MYIRLKVYGYIFMWSSILNSTEPRTPGELIGLVASIVHHPLSVIRQHFQRTLPLKLLGQFQLNSLCRNKKVCILLGPFCLTKMAAMSKYGKNLIKSSSLNH